MPLPAMEAFLGLQASALPDGAQQVPVIAPCGLLKLQAWSAASLLHAARASGGGPSPGLGWAWAGVAARALNKASAATEAPTERRMDKGEFIKSSW
jgi:hypothetical protein